MNPSMKASGEKTGLLQVMPENSAAAGIWPQNTVLTVRRQRWVWQAMDRFVVVIPQRVSPPIYVRGRV